MAKKLTLLAATGSLCVMAALPAGAIDEYPIGDSFTGPALTHGMVFAPSEAAQAGVAGPRGESFTDRGPAAIESTWAMDYPVGDDHTGPALTQMPLATTEENLAGVSGPRGESLIEEGPAGDRSLAAVDPVGGYNFNPPYLTD